MSMSIRNQKRPREVARLAMEAGRSSGSSRLELMAAVLNLNPEQDGQDGSDLPGCLGVADLPFRRPPDLPGYWRRILKHV
jgi:hypothetical protein